MDEDVDLGDERLEERADLGGEARQQGAEGRGDRLRVFRGERGDERLAVAAMFVQAADVHLDLAAEAEDGVGIAGEEALLLLFEEMEEAAVFGDLLAEGVRDVRPIVGHGQEALGAAGAAATGWRGES